VGSRHQVAFSPQILNQQQTILKSTRGYLMSAPDNQVSQEILQLLYSRFNPDDHGFGVDRAIIQALLGLSEKEMDDNVSYLEEKALVTVHRGAGAKWMFAKITPEGNEAIGNRGGFSAEKLPFAQAAPSQIPYEKQHYPDMTEPGEPPEFSDLSFPEQLSEAFDKANHQVFAKNISGSEKGKIEKQLRELEKELRKMEKADLGKIQQIWVWLKKNAGWVNPTIAQVVLEGVKTALEIS
jgi:hypothetical protein